MQTTIRSLGALAFLPVKIILKCHIHLQMDSNKSNIRLAQLACSKMSASNSALLHFPLQLIKVTECKHGRERVSALSGASE